MPGAGLNRSALWSYDLRRKANCKAFFGRVFEFKKIKLRLFGTYWSRVVMQTLNLNKEQAPQTPNPEPCSLNPKP